MFFSPKGTVIFPNVIDQMTGLFSTDLEATSTTQYSLTLTRSASWVYLVWPELILCSFITFLLSKRKHFKYFSVTAVVCSSV